MFQQISRLHAKLIGTSDVTSLQARIFHEVSLIALVGLPLALIVNLFIDVPYVNTALIATWCMFAILYINSRVYGRLEQSILIFGFGTSLILGVNYFINSGIQGPTLMLYLMMLVFTQALLPTRRFVYWVLFNILLVVSLLGVEFFRPELIRFTYADASDLYLDTATTYVCVVLCIGTVLYYLIHCYELEKNNAIKASEALKIANDSKTRLISILSHDLRSPFNTIENYLGTLNEFELSAEERQFVEKSLLNETKNMQVMLNNLLSWTKSQMDGGIRVRLTTLNLHKIIDECLIIQRSSAELKDLQLQAEIPQDLMIIADENMLKLVVQNLINNAIKFTPSKGTIRLSARLGQPGIVELIMMDNGIGIPEDRQANLFTFHAVSTYGTDNEKGVGLGLILCKEYTELQNGSITFTSHIGRGTTFYLEFPEATTEKS